ncbi:hypothetical protein V8F06_005108 [Rhypophila decipiens]
MRCAYISVAAAALCLDGVLALGSLHRGNQRNYRNTGRAVLTGASEHHKVNQTGVSGKDHGHAYHKLDMRQAGGRCGSQYGRCPDDLCCSDYGYCGDSVDHCAPLFDCQPQFGVCGWPRAPPPPVVTTTSTTSTTSSTTSTTSTTSSTSTTPTSTSTSTTSTTSSTSTTPTSTSTTSSTSSTSSTSGSPSTPTGTAPGGLVITSDGRCGNGTSCIGNPNYGPCCSQFEWCGSSLDFCGAGCQSQFGACLGIPGQPPVSASNVTTIPGPTSTSTRTSSSSTSTSTSAPPVIITTSTTSTSSTRTTSTTSSAPPTPTVVIPPGFRTSTDGTCGPGITCLGSTYGRCCSQFGWCGDGDQFCPYIVGCQSEYGYCDPRP